MTENQNRLIELQKEIDDLEFNFDVKLPEINDRCEKIINKYSKTKVIIYCMVVLLLH